MINSLATGGAENLVVNLAISATKEGDECEILCLAPSNGVPMQRAIENGVTVKVLGNSLWDPRLLLRMWWRTRRAEIIHVHLFPALYWAALLPGNKVFTEHSTHNRRMRKAILAPLERLVYSSYKTIFAISDGVAFAIKKYFADLGVETRIEVAPNGIGDEFFDRRNEREPRFNRIVSVGSLKEVKRHHLSIETLSLLPEAILSIAGKGPLLNELETLSKDLGVDDRVYFLGEVSDVKGLLERNDVLLVASEYEGFSLAAAEAQATGMPVVGPDVEGFNEVVIGGQTGELFADPNPMEIARMLEKVLTRENYPAYSEKAMQNAKRFSVRESYTLQRSIYDSLLRRGN